MKPSRIILLAILPLLAVGLYAAGQWLEKRSATQGAQYAADTQQVATDEDESTPVTGGLPLAGEKTDQAPQADRDVLAYITEFSPLGSGWVISLDYVNWLTGQAAIDAATAAGDCVSPNNCLPNGVYIENSDDVIHNFRVHEDVSITLQSSLDDSGQFAAQQVSLDAFRNYFTASSESALKTRAYNIGLNANTVVSITEKFLAQ